MQIKQQNTYWAKALLILLLTHQIAPDIWTLNAHECLAIKGVPYDYNLLKNAFLQDEGSGWVQYFGNVWEFHNRLM